MKKRRLLYLFPLAALVLSGCSKQDLMFWKKKNNEPEQQEEQKEQGGEQQGGEQGGEQGGGGEQQQKQDFVGLSLPNATVTYDGQSHSLEVAGDLPAGATVDYGDAGNSFTEVGPHEVTATVSCEGYNDLVLHGTLTIVASDFAGLSFADASVEYDGQPHSISVSGDLPQGAEVSYAPGNSFTAVGEHEITATVSCVGYNDLVLHATLTITKGNMVGITFEDQEVAFDGNAHEIAPVIPAQYAGATVDYGEGGNSFVGSGIHVVTATISCEGYNDVELTAKLTIGPGPAASQELNLVDFEDMSDNDLVDEFTLEFYNNGWVTPQAAKLGIEKNQVYAGGTNTMKMTMTHQGSAFKATKQLTNKTYSKYKGFSVDTMMDSRAEGGTMKVEVQFWFKDLPLPDAYAGYRNDRATYTLSNNAPSIWTHWEIPFTDESLLIAGNATITQAFLAQGYTVEDFSSYIDKVAIIITPNYKDGKNCYAYIDNIKLTTNEDKVVDKYIYGGKYVRIEGEDTYALNLADDLATGSFLINDVEASALTITKNGENIVAKDATYAGAGLTVTARIEDDGSLTVVSVDGQAAATYSGLVDMNFVKHANVNLDFTGASVGNPLNDSHWYQEYWNETWQTVSGKMNVRGDASNPHCNMGTGYYYDYRYTYTYPEHFGLADKFSIDISNDWDQGSHDLKLKIKLVGQTGSETYVVGSSGAYETIPANTAKWMHIENNNFGEVNVKAIVVVVKSTGSYNQWMYFDNLMLSHSTPEVTPPPQPTYNVEDGEYYIWNSASDAYRLTIADSQTTGTFTKCGSEDEYDVTVAVDGNAVTIKDATANGAGLTVNAVLTEDNLMTVESVEGAMASALSASLTGKTVKHSASANLNFSDGTDGSYYQESHWKESKYGNSGWSDYAAPTDMRGKVDKNGNKVVNMHCGTGAKNFRYTPDLPFGPINHVEVDLGNYWASSPGELRYKISILGSDGSTVQKYVAGDGNNWATLAKDTSNGNICTTMSFDFDLCVGYAIRITTSMASGEAYLYMDNLKVTYKAPEPVTPPQPAMTIVDGDYYIWNGSSDAFRLNIADSLTSATVTKCGGDSYAMTVEVNDETVTLKDAGYAGAGLTITASITAENTMTVTGVTGQMASIMSGSLLNKTVKHCADVSLDFSDGAGSGTYSNAHWTGQEYTTAWNDVTPDMNSRKDASDNKVVNLVAGGYTRNFIYTPDLPMGPVNHVEFDMANYFSGSAGSITVKVCVIDGGGTKYYALGNADNFVTLAKDTSNGSVLNHYDLPINLCAGAKVQITAKASAGTSYLYVDNIHVGYSSTIAKVAYKLTDTTGWDINTDTPEFYAWVWGGSDQGHWEKLTLKTDDGKYFDLSLFNTYQYVKIVRVDPAATTKPKQGSYSYGTYDNNEIWNETGDIALNGTGGNVSFSF